MSVTSAGSHAGLQVSSLPDAPYLTVCARCHCPGRPAFALALVSLVICPSLWNFAMRVQRRPDRGNMGYCAGRRRAKAEELALAL